MAGAVPTTMRTALLERYTSRSARSVSRRCLQGAIGVDGVVHWRDNSARPRLRWVTVTEKEMLDMRERGIW
jgi:hypothetical protein